MLLLGYAAGIVLAAVLTTFAVSTRIGTDLLSTLTAMFNPLPAIALLPLALIWFGLGIASLVFVIVHSVLWAVALNTLTGFRSVPETLRMAAAITACAASATCAADPDPRGVSLDPGRAEDRLGVCVAHADRSRTGVRRLVPLRRPRLVHLRGPHRAGNRRVFAGLLTVILIGLTVEAVIFRFIEKKTVLRWGMQR